MGTKNIFRQEYIKAFDTVNTEIMLEKLHRYGLPVDWFKHYLENRKQYTFINGAESADREVNCGVPQGSILGPLLFLLYINDLPHAAALLALLYADDTTLMLAHKDPKELYRILNHNLEKMEDWFAANFLTLHPKKTRFIHYGKKPEELSLSLCGDKIEQIHDAGKEKSFKLVGVHLDENLTWKHHIGHIRTKVLKSMIMIIKAKHTIPRPIKIMLHKALVQCHIDYCLPIWGSAKLHIIKPLTTAIKKALRAATGSRYNAHTQPLHALTGTLTLAHLHEYKCLKIGVQAKLGRLPRGLEGCFNFSHPERNNRSTDTLSMVTPRFKTDLMRKLPHVQIPEIWNKQELPAIMSRGVMFLKCNYFSIRMREYEGFLCERSHCYTCTQET